jgi:hypothetical protein
MGAIKRSVVAMSFLAFISPGVYAEKMVDKKGEILEFIKSGSGLTIKWKNSTKVYKNIIGIEGHVYKDVSIFNGQPSLFYSSVASRMKYDIHYTLYVRDHNITIDCAYVNINDSGLTINNAVCGLNKTLVANCPDLIGVYASKWREDAYRQMNKYMLSKKNGQVDILMGDMEDISIIARYKTKSDIQDYNFQTIARKNGVEYDLGKEKIYLIYLIGDSAVGKIERQVSVDEANGFKVLTRQDLKNIFSD